MTLSSRRWMRRKMTSFRNKSSYICDMNEMENKGPETKFLGSVSPNKGHRIYQLDTETGEISEAHVEGKVIELPDGRKEIRKQIFVRDKFLYVSALNKRNAVKRFARMARMLDNQNNKSNETIGENAED